MVVQQTSLLAYRSLNNLGERQQQVFNVIKKLGKCSNIEISKILNLPINSITGRTNELMKNNLIECKEKKICTYTKRKVILWGLI